jgi:hypothetical protein
LIDFIRAVRRSGSPAVRIRAVRRSGGPAVCIVVLLLTARPPDRLTAQGLLEQFSYDNLRLSAVQLDIGPLGGNNIKGTTTGGVRLDYGFIAPKIRVLLGLSYFEAQFSADAQRRFKERLDSLVQDPTNDFTINLGRITLSDVAGDLDLQYVLPQGRAVTVYLGVGVGVHLRNGSGTAINGTFVEDALDEITAGLNGTLGAEVGSRRWRFTIEGRGMVSSGLSTLSVRTGVAYRWAGTGEGAKRSR